MFTSGVPTSYVKSNDIKAEVSETVGHQQIATATVDFIRQRLGSKAYSVDSYTKSLLQPIIDALLLEGYYYFKPPCYGHELLNPNVPTCGHGSQWANLAQSSMAGLDGTKTRVVVDSNFHQVQSVNPVHLPEIDNDCDGVNACDMHILSVVEALYEKLADLDTASTYISASELKIKLVSRQNAWMRGGKKA